MPRIGQRTIIITGIAALVTAGGALLFWVTASNTASVVHGTSDVPALDIVSGELSETSRESVPATIENISGHPVTGRDIVVRPGSYQKAFDDAGVTSQISFVVDVSSIRASYQVLASYTNGSPIGTQVTCAAVQSPGYTCTMPVPMVEN